MTATAGTVGQRKPALRIALLGVAYLLVACIAIGANPFKGETTGPFDLLASFPGWNPTDESVSVRHGARSDILDSLLPSWIEASRQMRQGHLPLWDPLAAGGRATLVDPTRALVSPAFLVFALSPDPELGFYLATLLNLCIAGLGMHLLVRRYLSTASSFFAGISYMFCGFFAAWLFWPHILTAIWLPWLLLFTSLELDRHAGWKVLAIALCTALMFMGGFPFVMAIGLGCALSMIVGHLVAPWCSDQERWTVSGPVWTGFALLAGLGLVFLPLLSLYAMIGNADLDYRSGGSFLTLSEHAKLLLQPWAGRRPAVETNMYVGMLALVLAVPGFIRALLRPRSMIGVCAIFYLAVGLLLTFGLLPDWIGLRLPVLSNNPWWRAILLLDLAIILLAAIGLDALVVNRRWKPGAVVASVLLILVQTGDLVYQFRKFNGTTEGGHFYQTEDIVADLHEDLGPFEYVSQDGGIMLISGTTGALGLGDWFAHSMRSTELHNLLDAMAGQPFSSPTATMIDGSEYHWDRPIMDMTGNCYLIDAAGAYFGPELLAPAPGTKFAIGPINSRTVSQGFKLDRPVTMAAVSLGMATYHQAGLAGHVDLAVSPRADAASPLASARVDASIITDNTRIAFVFDQPVKLEAGAYQLQVRYRPAKETRNLTIWAFEASDAAFSVDGKPRQGALGYAILGPSSTSAMKTLKTEGGLAVYENPGCMKGAYWTHDLTDPLASSTVNAVEMLSYTPHDFSMKVTADREGFLVIPMNLLPGWRFLVNGVESEMRTLAGVMPAVRLPPGQHIVRAVYRPPYLIAGLVVSIGTALLLFLVLFGRRLRPPRKRRT